MDLIKRMSALQAIALVVLAAACHDVLAIGLGPIQVQSALSQPLRAAIPLLGNDATNIADLCPKGSVQTIDGVRLARLQIGFANGEKPSALAIATSRAVNEPVVTISIEVGCGTPVSRNYQILLDPVTTFAAPAVQMAAPAVVTIHPVQQPASASAPGVTSASPAKESNAVNRHTAAQHRHAVHQSSHAKKVRHELNPDRASTLAEKKHESAGRRHARKGSHSVLRLSADVAPVYSSNMFTGLKLSDTLTAEGMDADPQSAAELREAQKRFALIARDEDPETTAQNETRAAQEKIQALLQEAGRIRQQREQDRLAFEAEQKKSLSIKWFFALCAVFLLALIALIWLARRLYQVNKANERPFWDHYDSDYDTNTGSDTDHEASPFADTAAEFDDTMSSNESGASSVFAETGYGASEADAKGTARRQSTSAGSENQQAQGKNTETSAEIVPLPKQVVAMRGRKRAEMIEVEEISDAMEEAEFWISLRDPQRAISVLEQFRDVEKPKSPMAWLYLLKLYREVGDRSRFDALVQRFKSHFNTKAPEWDAKSEDVTVKGLEDYPHLLEQICALWGSDRAARYLEDLMFNNRSGRREGFDLPVYLDLLMLANIAYEVFTPNRNGKPATVSRI